MKSLDNKTRTSAEIQAAWTNELEAAENKSEKLAELTQELSFAVAQERAAAFIETATLSMNNAQAKKDLGLRTLSKEENDFYNAFCKMLKDPKAALTTSQTAVFPTTIITKLLEDIKQTSALLSYISVAPAGVTKLLVGDYTGAGAWGKITDAIAAELTATIEGVDCTSNRAAAFIAAAKGLVDLGNEYVDAFLRAILQETLLNTLEIGVVDGTGKDMPVGMNRNLSSVASGGTYNKKTKVDLKSFMPSDYGAVLAKLTKGGKRAIKEVILVVNPEDQLTKVLGASTVLNSGQFSSIFPFPTIVIPSVAVAKNEAILGIGKNYSFGISSTQLEVYGETRALNDEYLYLIKAYANGRASDNDSFLLLNITDLQPLATNVAVTNTVTTKTSV